MQIGGEDYADILFRPPRSKSSFWAWLIYCFIFPSPIRNTWNLVWGTDLEYPEDDGDCESGIREGLVVVQIFVAQVFAFIVSLQNAEGPGRRQTVYFCFFSVFVAAMLILMLRARPGGGKLKMHLYNHGSVRFFRYILLVVFVLTPGLACLAESEEIPGQTHIAALSVIDVAPHQFSKVAKAGGIRLYFDIQPSLFKEGLPESLEMSIAADPEFNKIWRVVDVEGYDITGSPDLLRQFDSDELKKFKMRSKPAVEQDTNYDTGEGSRLNVFIHGLEKTNRYRIRVLLRARSGIEMTGDRRNFELEKLTHELKSPQAGRPLKVSVRVPRYAQASVKEGQKR